MEEKSFISIAQTYLDRFPVFSQQLNEQVKKDLEICIVIPAFNEPDIERSLDSISNCDVPEFISVDVIIVVNHPEGSHPSIINQNKQTLATIDSFRIKSNHHPFSFYTIYACDLTKKHAGVGWARKIGMDEAMRRFMEVNKDGLICCFDADAIVDSNYIIELINSFKTFNYNGASVYFEHPLEGSEFSEEVYDGILKYELHLRYYKNALKYCGVPYAFHTVGSSMVVKASAYAKQGGMNRRKAGEDFYFINKIISLGDYGEVNNIRVIPSPRVSDRVPFGTGRAIQEKIDGVRDLDLTYSFQIFSALKSWLSLVIEEAVYEYDEFPEFIKLYIEKEYWDRTLHMIQSNSASPKAFINRFFRTFDAFWILKFVHYIKENHISDTSLALNSNCLLNEFNISSKNTLLELLCEFRKIDKQ